MAVSKSYRPHYIIIVGSELLNSSIYAGGLSLPINLNGDQLINYVQKHLLAEMTKEDAILDVLVPCNNEGEQLAYPMNRTE